MEGWETTTMWPLRRYAVGVTVLDRGNGCADARDLGIPSWNDPSQPIVYIMHPCLKRVLPLFRIVLREFYLCHSLELIFFVKSIL
jgi:hypothetical protein